MLIERVFTLTPTVRSATEQTPTRAREFWNFYWVGGRVVTAYVKLLLALAGLLNGKVDTQTRKNIMAGATIAFADENFESNFHQLVVQSTMNSREHQHEQ